MDSKNSNYQENQQIKKSQQSQEQLVDSSFEIIEFQQSDENEKQDQVFNMNLNYIFNIWQQIKNYFSNTSFYFFLTRNSQNSNLPQQNKEQLQSSCGMQQNDLEIQQKQNSDQEQLLIEQQNQMQEKQSEEPYQTQQSGNQIKQNSNYNDASQYLTSKIKMPDFQLDISNLNFENLSLQQSENQQQKFNIYFQQAYHMRAMQTQMVCIFGKKDCGKTFIVQKLLENNYLQLCQEGVQCYNQGDFTYVDFTAKKENEYKEQILGSFLISNYNILIFIQESNKDTNEMENLIKQLDEFINSQSIYLIIIHNKIKTHNAIKEYVLRNKINISINEIEDKFSNLNDQIDTFTFKFNQYNQNKIKLCSHYFILQEDQCIKNGQNSYNKQISRLIKEELNLINFPPYQFNMVQDFKKYLTITQDKFLNLKKFQLNINQADQDVIDQTKKGQIGTLDIDFFQNSQFQMSYDEPNEGQLKNKTGTEQPFTILGTKIKPNYEVIQQDQHIIKVIIQNVGHFSFYQKKQKITSDVIKSQKFLHVVWKLIPYQDFKQKLDELLLKNHSLKQEKQVSDHQFYWKNWQKISCFKEFQLKIPFADLSVNLDKNNSLNIDQVEQTLKDSNELICDYYYLIQLQLEQ